MTDEYEGEERRRHRKEPWHLSRSVPISLITAILLQTGAMFWYGGGLEHRVLTLEATAETTISTTVATAEHRLLQIQITNNDETDDEIKDTLEAINSKLDRLIERQ